MPKPEIAYLKFNEKEEQKIFMHPFSVFMDFECTLKNIDHDKNKNSFNNQEHVPNSVGIKFICIHDQFSKPIKIINNSDQELLLKEMMENLEKLSKYS